jgi:secreted Zn-dependent insulinase-like peptidase
MSDNELDELKDGVLDSLNEDIKSLQNEGDMFWEHILNDDLAFEEKQVAAATVRNLRKEVPNQPQIIGRGGLLQQCVPRSGQGQA